jgi:hypothetical protein
MATIDGLLLGGRPDSEGCADHGAAIAYRLAAAGIAEHCQVASEEAIWVDAYLGIGRQRADADLDPAVFAGLDDGT